jgi:hypothetical protein
VFLRFTECTQVGCQVNHGSNPRSTLIDEILGIDYLTFNNTSLTAGYYRFRQPSRLAACSNFQRTTASSTNSITNNNFFDMPLCVITSNSFAQLISPAENQLPVTDLNLNTAALPIGAYSQNFEIGSVSTNSTLTGNFRTIISSLQKNARLSPLPTSLPILKNQIY